MAISDYCINVEHLLYGTLLSFQLKIYNERKNVEVGVARWAPSVACSNWDVLYVPLSLSLKRKPFTQTPRQELKCGSANTFEHFLYVPRAVLLQVRNRKDFSRKNPCVKELQFMHQGDSEWKWKQFVGLIKRCGLHLERNFLSNLGLRP